MISPTKKFVVSYYRAFLQPATEGEIIFARLFVCLFFAYKLLSRDFSYFANIDNISTYAPFSIYRLEYKLFLGLPYLSELTTFHWIHFFLPYPTGNLLFLIQSTAVVLSLLCSVFGFGYKNIVGWLLFVILIYLWGYLFNGRQEVDAVALYFGCFLVLLFYQRKSNLEEQANHRAIIKSLLISVFATYYFASGLNKLSDISILEWFANDFRAGYLYLQVLSDNTPVFVPRFFGYVAESPIIHFIGIFAPPLAYLSHIFAPIILWRRDLILKFALFYAAFHSMVFGLGISFTGYIFVWLIILPYPSYWAKFKSNWIRT